MNGKGDKRRRSQVPESEVLSNWERIFNKQDEKESKKFNTKGI